MCNGHESGQTAVGRSGVVPALSSSCWFVLCSVFFNANRVCHFALTERTHLPWAPVDGRSAIMGDQVVIHTSMSTWPRAEKSLAIVSVRWNTYFFVRIEWNAAGCKADRGRGSGDWEVRYDRIPMLRLLVRLSCGDTSPHLRLHCLRSSCLNFLYQCISWKKWWRDPTVISTFAWFCLLQCYSGRGGTGGTGGRGVV